MAITSPLSHIAAATLDASTDTMASPSPSSPPPPPKKFHARIVSHVQKRKREWAYRAFGPTTVHLRHEVCLLIALTCCTVSNISMMYKSSVGIKGDFILMALIALWLSRHLLIRWMCTMDQSTNRSPTSVGVLVHWMTTYVNGAGQYFDRPSLHVVGKQIGTTNVDDVRAVSSKISLLFPSLHFSYQYAKVTFWHPMMELWDAILREVKLKFHHGIGGSRNGDSGADAASSDADNYESNTYDSHDNNNKQHNSSTPSSSKRKNRNRHGNWQSQQGAGALPSTLDASGPINTIKHFLTVWAKFWDSYGPPIQMLIPLCVFLFYIWKLFFSSGTPEETRLALTMNPHAAAAQRSGRMLSFDDETEPHGAYARLDRPNWSQIMFWLSSIGTIFSIVWFGRLFLPFPDLVAGGSVLKAIRNEAKSIAQHGTSKSKSRVQRDIQDVPWTEQYISIVNENRFRLVCKVASLRAFEHIFVCILFPRLGVACRASGHCSEGVSLRHLSRILYFAGVTSPLREDANERPRSGFGSDAIMIIMLAMSMSVITFSLLLGQTATLNRSYLSIMGYLAGEWMMVDEDDPDLSSGPTPSAWDPRRKYKKGDIIAQQTTSLRGQTYYKAMTNSPEGRPLDLYLRASHDFFMDEMGSPVRSEMIETIAMVQLAFLLILICVFVVYKYADYPSGGLAWMLFGNMAALVGTLNGGMPNYSRIHQLAQELST